MDIFYSTINIFEKLKEKYRQYLRDDISAISIIQSEDEVCLEIVSSEVLEDGLEKEIIKRDNLEFIREDEQGELMFNPEDPIEVNARKFINELSPYSIINTTDLFHIEACEQISKKYNIKISDFSTARCKQGCKTMKGCCRKKFKEE